MKLRRLARRAVRALRGAAAEAVAACDSAHHGRGLVRFEEMLASVGLPSLRAHIEDRLTRQPKVRLLEVGCGEGHLLLDLLDAFGDRLDLVGINAPGWRVAWRAEHLLATNRRYRVLDEARLRALPLPKVFVADVQDLAALPERDFDLIISLVVLPHVRDKARALEACARRLRAEGELWHHLDTVDESPLPWVNRDLPRFSIERDGRSESTTAHLGAHGLTVHRDPKRVFVRHRRSDAPLDLGLALDAGATQPMNADQDRAPGVHLWGVRSVYRHRPA